MLRRTDKPIKPYTSRGPDPNYKGPFPWAMKEHWRRIEQSPVRVTRKIANKLDEPSYREPDWHMQFRFPEMIGTCTELGNVRKALLQFFAGKQRDYDWWLPRPLHYLFTTGENLHLLFMDMLVRPVFEDEQFVKFVAVDPKEAQEEIERLTAATGDVPEKYRRYLQRAIVEVT